MKGRNMSTSKEPPGKEPAESPATGATEDAVATRSDTDFWAKGVTRLDVTNAPEGAINLNVSGKRVVSPIQGFGQLWQKTYRINLGDAVEPVELMKTWRERFSEFWPKGNRFYGPLTGIAPGEVALLNLALPGRMKLSTGVLVLYADEESFTFMTPQGHGFAAFITFSAAKEEGDTIAQVQALLRAGDPIYEMAMVLRIQQRMEDRFWEHTLRALAANFGVDAPVEVQAVCVDRQRQWRNAKNIWHNAAVRSAFYVMGGPLRFASRSRRSRAPSARPPEGNASEREPKTSEYEQEQL
jgi:hypothetical protein